MGFLRCCDGYSTVTGFPQTDPIESSTSSPNSWSQLPSGVAGATTPITRSPTSPMTDSHPRILSIALAPFVARFNLLRHGANSTQVAPDLDRRHDGALPASRPARENTTTSRGAAATGDLS